MALVVEGEHELADHQRHVGEPERVRVRLPELLHRAHEVVAEEPHGPAGERRELPERGEVEAVDQLGGGRVGIAVVAQRPAQRRVGAKAQERIAAQPSLLGRFEQMGGAIEGGTELEEGGHRRLAVIDEPVAHRDYVLALRQLPCALERRLDGWGNVSGDGH